jgi:hypothetical protein
MSSLMEEKAEREEGRRRVDRGTHYSLFISFKKERRKKPKK